MLTQGALVGSDDWWVLRLGVQLGADFPRLYKLDSYMDGTNPLPSQASPQMKAAYAQFLALSNLNFGHAIVSSATSKQRPIGFNTAVTDDGDGDKVAMLTYKNSHLDVYSRDLFQDVGLYGSGFTLNDGQGRILKLSPWNTTLEASPLTPWQPDAALFAAFNPTEGADILTLFRPSTDGAPAYSRRAVKETATTTIPTNGTAWSPGLDWSWIEDPQPIRWLPAGELPVIDYRAPDGLGQFEAHVAALDRINQTILDRLTITAMQAFRQRGIQGSLDETYPENDPMGRGGQKVDYNSIFQAGPAALWTLPADAKVWESQVTDITPILAATDKDLRYLASASRTPLYMLSPEAAQGSAEGAAQAAEGLNSKVDDLNSRAKDSLARAMANSFAAQGDTERSNSALIECLFENPRRMTVGEAAAAASQAVTSMSRKGILKYVFGLTPSQIDQEESDWDEQAFATAAAGLQPAAAGSITNITQAGNG